MSVAPKHKTGLFTTEFWLSLAATALCGLAVSYTEQPWAQAAGAIGAALVAMGYGVNRAKTKVGR